MSQGGALPTSIDEVIARLSGIVDDAAQRGSRFGYFAALYNRVTMAVRDGIRAGRFDDNARMERLDVLFANRYIEAYDTWRSGHAPSASWQTAFVAAQRPDLSVLQHLMLGMNAHINLDLGIAAATVAPGASIHDLHADFNRINEVLASLLPAVEGQLADISPVLDAAVRVGDHLDNLDDRVSNFSMEQARDGAWRFAVRLSDIDSPLLRQVAIRARDGVVAALGVTLQKPGPMSLALGGADIASVTANIRILARDEDSATA